MLNLATKDDIKALDTKLNELIAIQSKQIEIIQEALNNKEDMKEALEQLEFKKAYKQLYSAYSELNKEHLKLQQANQDLSKQLEEAEERIKKNNTAFQLNRQKIKKLKENLKVYSDKILGSNLGIEGLSIKNQRLPHNQPK